MKDRGFKIALNLKFIGYQRGLESMVYTFLDKKTRSRVIATSKGVELLMDKKAITKE